MAYSSGNPLKVGPQTLVQHVEIPVTIDTATSGTISHTLSIVPSEVYFRYTGAATTAGLVWVNPATTTASVVGLVSNGTACTGVLVVKAYSQAG